MDGREPFLVSVLPEGKHNFTPFAFYNDFLPKIRESLISINRNHYKLCFDLTRINIMNPLALANFLIVGKILKEYLGYPIEIILNRNNAKMIKFLDSIGLFRLLEKNQIYSFDQEFIAEYTASKYGDLGILLCLPLQQISSTEIIKEILNNNQKISAFIQHFDDYDLAETFAYSVGELIHNCMVHGKSSVFFSVYGGPKMGLNCAVSDCGFGYLTRILKKPAELVIFSQNELEKKDKYTHLRAIIEAVFKRFNKQTYGLTSVIRSIANINGTTRIHSQNTQIVFTPKNSYLLRGSDVKINGRKLYDFLLEAEASANTLQSSSLRIRETVLSGVHVEFEFPANRKKQERGEE